MRSMGSFALTTSGKGFDFYLQPPFHTRRFLWIFAAWILLCAYPVFILVKTWPHLSASTIGWIAFGMLWAILLIRGLLQSHGSLKALLASQQVDPRDEESPLGAVLDIVERLSYQVLLLSFFSVGGLLMAIDVILSRR